MKVGDRNLKRKMQHLWVQGCNHDTVLLLRLRVNIGEGKFVIALGQPQTCIFKQRFVKLFSIKVILE